MSAWQQIAEVHSGELRWLVPDEEQRGNFKLYREPQWQPIATAPRNEYVLVCVDGDVRIGVLWEGYRRWESDGYGESSPRPGSMDQPTHWMPLPEPPK